MAEFLQRQYKTHDLHLLKPMALPGNFRGHDFAREKVVTQRVRINASAARLHHLVQNMQPDANNERSCRYKLRDMIGHEAFDRCAVANDFFCTN